MILRIALVMVVAGGCGRGEDVRAPVITGPVIYGADDRLDWYAVEDPALKTLTHGAIAAMVSWGEIGYDEAGEPLPFGGETLGQGYGLCADQRFREQPTAAGCSGTLIGADLVLTAGHCVSNLSDCAASAWVFDYLYEADGTLATLTADSIYRCVDVVVRPGVDLEDDLDMAIVQLDRTVVGREPVMLAADSALQTGDGLIMVGFPSGIPMKVDAGGLVASPRTQQGNYFLASVDAFGGNSGSGVLNRDHALVGVLVAGANDYTSAGSCTVVALLDPDEAEESVMYAHFAIEKLCERGYPSAELCPEAAAPTCGDGFCTELEPSEGCAIDCGGLFAVPPEWTCNAGWYDAGDDCDCACGAYDPDCDDKRLDVINCIPGTACNEDGTCAEPIPAEWRCSASSYGDGGRCNCDCGLPDPDCADPSLDETGCAPGGVCQADGTCTITLPAEWDCRRRFYGTGDGCDCDCGAYDPDCDDPDQNVYNCIAGSSCLADGSCELPIPAGWVCEPSAYGAGGECDCNCGIYDPDCDTSDTVRNCDGDDVCGADGTCVMREVEPQPEPQPEPEPEPEPEVTPEVGPDVSEEVEELDEVEAIAEPEPETAPETVSDTGESDVAEAKRAVRGGGCVGGDEGGAGLILCALAAGLRARRRRLDR